MTRRIGINKTEFKWGSKLKEFVKSKIEIIKLDNEDIIFTSVGGGIELPDVDIDGGGNGLPDVNIGGGGTTLPDSEL